MAPSKKRTKKALKPLAIATLMASSIIQPFTLPAFAAAGDAISNTATATYTDGDPTNVFETESNTVTVTVKEIAGITVTVEDVDDRNDGSYEDGDEVFFDFRVTNVGNDTSDIVLPSIGNIDTTNFVISRVDVLANDGTTTIGTYDTTPTTPQSVEALAQAAGTFGTTNITDDAGLGADDFIIVRVVGNISGAVNPGDDITVTLGETPPDNAQNQPLDTVNNPDKNVRTDDLDGATPAEVLTDADEKEASASNTVDFATQQKPLALATIKKSATSDPGDTGSADDDVITYALTLDVESASPNGAFIAEDLVGTEILLDEGGGATAVDRILVSDAVPEKTVFNSTVLPRVPAGGDWTVVYSTDDPSTTIPVNAAGATVATWQTAKPADNLIRRVGFIYDADPAESGPIAVADPTITGFEFDVTASGVPAVGDTIYNLAQVFGETFDDSDPTLADPVDQIIYDESGDDNPNNFDINTPPAETDGGTPDGSDYDPTEDTGVADPTNHGTDDGTNTGDGPDGEDHEITLVGEEETGDDNILNGPDGAPDAVGPTDDDDDYTNKGINPNDSGSDTVSFTNTVSNPSTNTSQIDNVTITPISPQAAADNDDDAATASSKYEGSVDATVTSAFNIPTGTEVVISYDPDGAGPAAPLTATYAWNEGVANDWELTAGAHVNIGTLNVGSEVDYSVTVSFPDNQPLEGDVVNIPLVAFPDTGVDGYTDETVNNITLDSVYVGFMSLTKEARILDTDGNIVQDWTSNNADLTGKAESGSIIEYRISYQNTSPSLVGSGNVSLSASDFQIVEDGDIFDTTTTVGDNNWDSDTTTPLTVHANGTVIETGTTVTYYDEFTDDGNDTNDSDIGTADPADGADVEAYVNDIGAVAPGEGGSMTFRRRVQ